MKVLYIDDGDSPDLVNSLHNIFREIGYHKEVLLCYNKNTYARLLVLPSKKENLEFSNEILWAWYGNESNYKETGIIEGTYYHDKNLFLSDLKDKYPNDFIELLFSNNTIF